MTDIVEAFFEECIERIQYFIELILNIAMDNLSFAFWAVAASIKSFLANFHDYFAGVGDSFVAAITSSGVFDVNFICDNFVSFVVGLAIFVMLLKLAINLVIAIIEIVATLIPL